MASKSKGGKSAKEKGKTQPPTPPTPPPELTVKVVPTDGETSVTKCAVPKQRGGARVSNVLAALGLSVTDKDFDVDGEPAKLTTRVKAGSVLVINERGQAS